MPRFQAALVGALVHGKEPLIALGGFLLATLVALGFTGVAARGLVDVALLARQGVSAEAVVTEEFDSGNVRVDIDTGSVVESVLLERIAAPRPAVGDAVQVIYDPGAPVRVRDARLPLWRPVEHWAAPVALVLLVWAHGSYVWWRWLRAEPQIMPAPE